MKYIEELKIEAVRRAIDNEMMSHLPEILKSNIRAVSRTEYKHHYSYRIVYEIGGVTSKALIMAPR